MLSIVFLAVPALMAAAALTAAALLLRWWWRVRTVLRTGERTMGRCLRIHTGVEGSDHHVRTVWHSIVEYPVPDGRRLRIRTRAPGTLCEGDTVTVAYLPHRPHLAALVRDDGRTGSPAMLVAATFLVAFAVVSAGFGAVGYFVAHEAETLVSTVPNIGTQVTTDPPQLVR
ncbi:DUF3592 domain-containing protein [Peterkaempfera sp. SMS 1(5)a]|uniref:DUF3592 domain-containing protein n=1 Tax=Peterkaempfera podocarpi TaxID=3232308 RepID=UPI00366E6453